MNYKKYDTSNGFGDRRKWRQAFNKKVFSKEEEIITAAWGDETPYEILGVASTATAAELKKAWRKKVMEWHPDRNAHRLEEATQQIKLINLAWEILKS